MSRISILSVEHYLDLLNTKTKNYYTLRVEGGKYTLVLKNKNGGQLDISRCNLSTTEIYEVVYAMNNLIYEENK